MRKLINLDSEEKVNSTTKAVNSSASANSSAATTDSANKANHDDNTFWGRATELCACFFALQVSYLIWGVMQESIMNTKFQPTPLNPSGMFPSATFCVFSNRFLAIIVAAVICYFKHGTLSSSAPLLYFTPCALSNTISSWSQYQALAFVSFSLQTLFKAVKVIPVMVMGRVLKGTHYSLTEYMEAIAITAGVATFSMNRDSHHHGHSKEQSQTELIGFILLCVYVGSDSFTSQWQSRIYRDYGKIDQYHMMLGVNMSSIIITTIALLASGDILKVSEFFVFNPSALWYNILTAITSTTGQIAIFYTIKRFGPIVFTIIMTTRQMLSILLSTVLFGHELSAASVLGAAMVFASVFHSIYRQVREKGGGIAGATGLKLPAAHIPIPAVRFAAATVSLLYGVSAAGGGGKGGGADSSIMKDVGDRKDHESDEDRTN